jgi:hypothetical protein
MTGAFTYYDSDVDRPDRTAHSVAGIVTAAVAILLLLLLWLITIKIPNPPIPPDKEAPTLEIDLGFIAGGTNQEMGGGSQGNTGEAGSQNSDPSNSSSTPNQAGSITNENSDAPFSPAKPTPGADQASVSSETQALLDKLKNKKNNTTIKIGGDGSGSPYSSGLGDGTGPGVGPNDGGIPGDGGDGAGKRYRKIVFKPDISNPTQEEGIVAVRVRVRKDGTVQNAEAIAAGSTTGNPVLKATATQSAYKIIFSEDAQGPELLELVVNINFTLQK